MSLSAISTARLQEVHPVLAGRTAQLAERLGLEDIPMGISQALRSWSQQDTLWNRGRTTPGAPCEHDGLFRPVGMCPEHPLGLTVTNAKGGQSMHNFGLAVDVFAEDCQGRPDWNVSHPAWQRILALAPVVKLAEGAVWRTFPDDPHLYPEECPAGPTDEMRQTFLDGGMASVWEMFPLS